MNFEDLIKSTQSRLKTARDQRSDNVDSVRSTLEKARRESRALTEAEVTVTNSARKGVERLNDEIAELDKKLDEYREMAREELEIAQLSTQRTPTNVTVPAYDQVARVGMEARTYRQDTDSNGTGFLQDVAKAYWRSDLGAEDRINRHRREEQVERSGRYGKYMERAAGTGAFAGLTVPQYLVELYAPATANMRPFANICNRHPLPPDGMTVNISRITTATSTALQSSENSAVSETNIDDTLLTESVQTAAGQQTLSRQAVERGSIAEEVTVQDLFKRYASTLDSTLITQATTGLSAVAQATTYTDASPSFAELWPKLFEAQNNVETALKAQATVDTVIMHSRRWNWANAQTSASFPLMGGTPNGQNFGMQVTNQYGPSVRAVLSNGTRVVVDQNIATNGGAGTNEDEIYVVASEECHLWEDPQAPVFIRAEQPAAATLGVLFVVYGYFAYSFRRYSNGMSKISGTGLVTPTF
jgi:hypothetical protein